jgi:hypothetical protein
MADHVVATSPNGNGHIFPLSRKAFNRGLPRRVGAIEDALDAQERRGDSHERRVDELVCRLTAIEEQPSSTASERFENFVEAVVWLADQMRPRNGRGQFIRSSADAASGGRRLARVRWAAAIVNQFADRLT